ncbi:MAG: sodium:solute symporter [Spirosomataceae bacterium]
MSPLSLFVVILLYFSVLMLISRFTSRQSHDTTFFDGDRQSPWYLVAFGMIGSGISAVSLVSIPGNVGNNYLYFFQFILGSAVGYVFIAFVLVPEFYKHRVVSLYSYLGDRFGRITYKTGSAFFLVSQSFGAALRLLLSIKILQSAFFEALHIPYWLSILVVLGLIWLYTNQSGIKTIVWTDALQSLSLITVIVISIFVINHSLGYRFTELTAAVSSHHLFRWFDFELNSASNFFKQFISGGLITVALVGLDQSMMQKTLTIVDAKKARTNVLTFSFFISFAQTLFLLLGILLYIFVETKGINLPMSQGKFTETDQLYPFLTMHYFGKIGVIAFFIGVVSSTFASIDSCIAALTTSISYDFFDFEKQSSSRKKNIKNGVLLGVNGVMFLIVLAFWNNDGAIINTIFEIAGYTYGPLLGIFLMGLFTKIQLKESFVPWVAVLAAILTYGLNVGFTRWLAFDFGFMNIAVNAGLTLLFLYFIRKR